MSISIASGLAWSSSANTSSNSFSFESGKLVSSLSERQWVQEALALLGREADPRTVEDVLAAIDVADGSEHRLDAPGMDTDAALHRQMFFDVLADTRLDQQLVETLYAVESDPAHNPFAEDVVSTVTALHGAARRCTALVCGGRQQGPRQATRRGRRRGAT